MNIPPADEELRAIALDAALNINGPTAFAKLVLEDAEDIYRWLKDGQLPEEPMPVEEIVKELRS